MKKFVILTSLLALTACGGGSHHPSERVRVSEQPTYEQPYLLTSEQTRASNAQITGMVSEISVCENCDSPRPNTGRKSTGIEHGNKTFTVYDLSDVKFTMADEGFGGELKFGVNNDKKITNFYIIDDDTEFTIHNNKVYIETENGELYLDDNGNIKTRNEGGGNINHNEDGSITYTSSNDGMDGTFWVINNKIVEEYTGEEFGYDDDNNLISKDDKIKIIDGKVYSYDLFVRTGDEDFTFAGYVKTEEEEPANAILTYNSFGKGKDIKLRYSDFGYFDIDVIKGWRPVFIGGYDEAKRIAVNDIENNENTKFKGRAIGSVMGRKTIDEHQYTDQEQLILEGKAYLVFNKGTSELTAEFGNWYDLKYTETGNNKSIEFSNYKDTPLETKKGEEDKVLTDYYRFISDDTTNKVEFNNVDSDIRYYGDDKVASEAVGLIQVSDTGANDDEVRMNLSFGVTEAK